LRLLDQPLEDEEIELGRTDPDQIARLLRDNRVAGGERLA
jgi:hypothetical protein